MDKFKKCVHSRGKFYQIHVFRCHEKRKTQFYPSSTLSFCGGSAQRCRDKVRMWLHIYKHSPIQRYQSHFQIPKHSWRSGIHKLYYLKVWQIRKQEKNIKLFCPLAVLDIWAPLYLAWWYLLFLHLQTCLSLTHSFATSGRWKFGITCTPLNLNPHNTKTPGANPPKF